MPQANLHDLEEFRAAVAGKPAVLLFKHSPICPVSARAREEWEAFRSRRPDAETLFVDVIADRAVARGLARECGVEHASPQAILFRGGRPVWDASHGAITAETLLAAWESGATGS